MIDFVPNIFRIAHTIGFSVYLYWTYVYIFGLRVGDIKSPIRLEFLGIYLGPMFIYSGLRGFLVGLFILDLYLYIRFAGWEWIVRENIPIFIHALQLFSAYQHGPTLRPRISFFYLFL